MDRGDVKLMIARLSDVGTIGSLDEDTVNQAADMLGALADENAKLQANLDRHMEVIVQGRKANEELQKELAAWKAAPKVEQEPTAFVVSNGLVKHSLFFTEKEAKLAADDLQLRHDMSGSWSSFNVKSLYLHPQEAQKVEQEPVAWRWWVPIPGGTWSEHYSDEKPSPVGKKDITPLYEHPAPSDRDALTVDFVLEMVRAYANARHEEFKRGDLHAEGMVEAAEDLFSLILHAKRNPYKGEKE